MSLAELTADLGPDGEALLGAASVDELRGALLHGGPRRTTCDEAVLLLRAHHAAAPGALDTARLLLTDRRWDRSTSALVRELVATGLLSDPDLDALARELLADEFLHYRLENQLLEHTMVIVLEDPAETQDDVQDGPEDPADVDTEDLGEMEGGGATEAAWTASRRIRPPLRRWAAARAAARSLIPLDELLARAEDLPARDAGEALRGVVDELASLPSDVAAPLLERALTWPALSVRRSALQHLLAHGEAKRARELAAADKDAQVREAFAERDEQTSLF